MQLSFFLPAVINAIGWSIKPVLEKIAVSHLGSLDFVFILYITAGLISIPVWLISLWVRKIRIKELFVKTYVNKMIYWGVIIALISLVSILPQYYLLKNNEACKVIGIVEATTALFGVVLATIILKERMSFMRWFGVAAIVVGIISLDQG